MRIINEKELDLTAGMVVTVSWDREKVEVEIRFVNGTFITKATFISHYHLHRVIIICHLHVSCVTHCRNGCMTKCCFLTQNSRRHVQTL